MKNSTHLIHGPGHIRPLRSILVLLLTFFASMSMESKGQNLVKSQPVRLLALGDSYTIGESVQQDQRWPVQLVSALMQKGYTCHQPEIVAVTGWRTDDLMLGIKARNLSNDYNLVSLLIGVNNQYQGKSIEEYKRHFEDLLTAAIEHAGADPSRVFVLSIPDYGYTPFGESNRNKISQQIDAFNAASKAITQKKGVTYVDITDISRQGLKDPTLVAVDGLHPSGKMYARWVERILEAL